MVKEPRTVLSVSRVAEASGREGHGRAVPSCSVVSYSANPWTI